MKPRIALLDDDEGHLELYALILSRAGMTPELYNRPARFLQDCTRSPADAAIVDVRLPGIDGREVIRVLRNNEETRRMALIAVSATARATADVVRGFTLGADEYLTKPVDAELLVGRIQALLRRSALQPPEPRVLRWKTLEASPDEGRVSVSGSEVTLTRQELRLLVHFLGNPERVMTRVMLLDHLWSGGAGPRTVDKHVETLRRKIPVFGERLETVVRVGYCFHP